MNAVLHRKLLSTCFAPPAPTHHSSPILSFHMMQEFVSSVAPAPAVPHDTSDIAPAVELDNADAGLMPAVAASCDTDSPLESTRAGNDALHQHGTKVETSVSRGAEAALGQASMQRGPSTHSDAPHQTTAPSAQPSVPTRSEVPSRVSVSSPVWVAAQHQPAKAVGVSGSSSYRAAAQNSAAGVVAVPEAAKRSTVALKSLSQMHVDVRATSEDGRGDDSLAMTQPLVSVSTRTDTQGTLSSNSAAAMHTMTAPARATPLPAQPTAPAPTTHSNTSAAVSTRQPRAVNAAPATHLPPAQLHAGALAALLSSGSHVSANALVPPLMPVRASPVASQAAGRPPAASRSEPGYEVRN